MQLDDVIKNINFQLKKIDNNQTSFGNVHLHFSNNSEDTNLLLDKFANFYSNSSYEDYFKEDLNPSDQNKLIRSVLIDIGKENERYNNANYINQNVNKTIFIQLVEGKDLNQIISNSSSIQSCTQNLTYKALAEGVTLGEFNHKSDNYVDKQINLIGILTGKYCDYATVWVQQNNFFGDIDNLLFKIHFSPQNWQLNKSSLFYDEILSRFGFNNEITKVLPPHKISEPELKFLQAPELFVHPNATSSDFSAEFANAPWNNDYFGWNIKWSDDLYQGRLMNERYQNKVHIILFVKNSIHPNWFNLGIYNTAADPFESWFVDAFKKYGEKIVYDNILSPGNNQFKFKMYYEFKFDGSNQGKYESDFSPVFTLCLSEDLKSKC